MDCPQCGRTMQSGYLNGGGRFVIWTRKKRRFLSTIPQDDDVMLCGYSLTGKGAPADHCPDCQMVIAKYETYE